MRIDSEKAFLPLLRHIAESMLAAMEADREGVAARVPEWLAQWMACPMQPQEDDGKRLWVAKCSDPAVAALLCGWILTRSFRRRIF